MWADGAGGGAGGGNYWDELVDRQAGEAQAGRGWGGAGEELGEGEAGTGRTNVVLVVDARVAMVGDGGAGGACTLERAVRALARVVRGRCAFPAAGERLGIVFYGAKRGRKGVLVPDGEAALRPACVAQVKWLEALVRGLGGFQEAFAERVGSADEEDIGVGARGALEEALAVAVNLVRQGEKKGRQRDAAPVHQEVHILTNDDAPYWRSGRAAGGGDAELTNARELCLTRAGDLGSMGARVELYPLKSGFDLKSGAFYREFLERWWARRREWKEEPEALSTTTTTSVTVGEEQGPLWGRTSEPAEVDDEDRNEMWFDALAASSDTCLGRLEEEIGRRLRRRRAAARLRLRLGHLSPEILAFEQSNAQGGGMQGGGPGNTSAGGDRRAHGEQHPVGPRGKNSAWVCLDLPVALHALLMPQAPQHTHYVYAEDNSELRPETTHLAGANGIALLPEQMGRLYTQADRAGQFSSANLPERALIFEAKDAKEWRSAGDEAGVAQLIGFRSMDEGPSWEHVLKPPSFMYPLEQELGGATVAFAALWQAMINRRVYGICRVRRSSATAHVRFCALVPCEEEVDENDVQVFPSGFQLIYLPWHEEVRDSVLKERLGKASQDHQGEAEATSAMVRLVRAMPLDPDVIHSIPDPVMSAHFAGLQSVAGLEPWDDEIEGSDLTLPSRELLAPEAARPDEIQSAVDAALVQVYGPNYEAQLDEARLAKEGEERRKKRKAEGPPTNLEGWRQVAQDGGVHDFSMPQLREALGGALSGSKLEPDPQRVKKARKDELVVLIHEALGLVAKVD